MSADAIETLIEGSLCSGLPKVTQKEWIGLSGEQRRQRIKRLVARITIRSDSVEIGLTEAGCRLVADSAPSGVLHIATAMKAGVGGRQIIPRRGATPPRVDRTLVRAITWARDLRQRLERDTHKTLDDLAREDGCSRPYVSSMIKLAYLAPDITRAILDGAQPAHLVLTDLIQRDIPANWAEQRRVFGFI